MAGADGRQRVLLQQRASETVTRAESYDENAEDCAYFMIRPDPRCPECNTIMDWRSAHRKNRVARERKERERKQHLPPGGVARSCSSPAPSLFSSDRPPIGD